MFSLIIFLWLCASFYFTPRIFAGKTFIDFVKAVQDREKYPTWPAVPAPKEEEKGKCYSLGVLDVSDMISPEKRK